jgi:hypothetical protein
MVSVSITPSETTDALRPGAEIEVLHDVAREARRSTGDAADPPRATAHGAAQRSRRVASRRGTADKEQPLNPAIGTRLVPGRTRCSSSALYYCFDQLSASRSSLVVVGESSAVRWGPLEAGSSVAITLLTHTAVVAVPSRSRGRIMSDGSRRLGRPRIPRKSGAR